jgi:hypothetical protein
MDAGASCTCPDVMRWGMTGFFGVPNASVLDCQSFTYLPEVPEGDTESLCQTVVGCDELQALQELLAEPAVQAAFAASPITYGRPDLGPDEGYYRIDLDRAQILLNAPCPPEQPECQDAPAEVVALRDILETITWRQLAKSSCVQELGQTCDDARNWSSRILSAAIDTADRSCQTTEDCVAVNTSTACNAGCGGLVAKAGEQQVADAIELLNATYCNDFENRCGPVLIPPCVPPPPVACTDNQCVQDYGEPTP